MLGYGLSDDVMLQYLRNLIKDTDAGKLLPEEEMVSLSQHDEYYCKSVLVRILKTSFPHFLFNPILESPKQVVVELSY